MAFFTNAMYIPWRVPRTGPAVLEGAVVRMGYTRDTPQKKCGGSTLEYLDYV